MLAHGRLESAFDEVVLVHHSVRPVLPRLCLLRRRFPPLHGVHEFLAGGFAAEVFMSQDSCVPHHELE
jgi:hypothetical protein